MDKGASISSRLPISRVSSFIKPKLPDSIHSLLTKIPKPIPMRRLTSLRSIQRCLIWQSSPYVICFMDRVTRIGKTGSFGPLMDGIHYNLNRKHFQRLIIISQNYIELIAIAI